MNNIHSPYTGSFDSTVRLWDLRAQSRQAIQVLEEAKDAIQTISIDSTTIITGSVDGHVRTYDLRKGELRSDFIGRKHRVCRCMLILILCRACHVGCAYARQPNTSCIHIRFPSAAYGYDFGENA